MKGMLCKDYYLMLQRKQTFLFILLFAVLAVLLGLTMSPYFITIYFCIVMMSLAESTITYDEFDNGMCFLMTLPVTPASYTLEKYILGSISVLTGWILSVIINTGFLLSGTQSRSLPELFSLTVWILPVILLMLGISIPLHFKYGAEKGKMVLLILYGALAAGIFGIGEILEQRGSSWERLADMTEYAPGAFVIFGGVFIFAGMMFLSYRISLAILNHKQY